MQECMSLDRVCFSFLDPQSILKDFVSHIYPKEMVAVTLHPDSSEDNLSACLALQLAPHFNKKARFHLRRFLSAIQPQCH